MTDDKSQPLPRRDFVSQIAVSALALAGTGCATGAAASASPSASTSSTPRPATQTTWDDSWFGRLKAKHRAVFEQPEIDMGSGPSYAVRYLTGMRDALGVDDAQAVVVLRHQAVPLVLDDAMWEKYGIGEERKLKGAGDAWQLKNPVATPRGASRTAEPGRPQGNVPWLTANGHIVLGCNIALQAYAAIVSRKVSGQQTTIYEELRAHLLPGVIMQPNGVYATHRAQEAGCTYIRCP